MKKRGIIILIIGLLLIVVGGSVQLFTHSDKKTTAIVLYKDEDGNILYQKQVKIGETVEKIEPDEREGFLFVDWYQDSVAYNFNTKVMKDIVLVGKWEEKKSDENTNLVIFYNDDDTLYESQQIVIGEKAKEPATPKSEMGGEFVGWFKGEEQFNFDTEITEKTILKAKYLEKQQEEDSQVSMNNPYNIPSDDPNYVNETDIQISVPSITMKLGEEVKFSVNVIPNNATIKDLSINCENELICAAYPDGTVRGVSIGSTNIIIESFHGIKKTIPITVKQSYTAQVAMQKLYITTSGGSWTEGEVTYKVKSTGEEKKIHVPVEGIKMEEEIEIISVAVND